MNYHYRKLLLPLLLVILLGIGCGSDVTEPEPNPPASYPTVEVAGAVSLPVGYTGDPAALTVRNGLRTAVCDASGNFSLRCYEDLIQFALLQGPNGDPLYLGWLSATDGDLSGRSTAEVLTYLGLGAWMLPPDAGEYIRDTLIDPATDLSALSAAVDAQLLLNPDGFTADNSDIANALASTITLLLAKTSPRSFGEKGLIVTPDSVQSGVDVSYRGGLNSLTIANSFRRRAVAFVWRRSYDSATEQDIPFADSEPIATLEVVPAAACAVAPGSIGAALAGDQSYATLDLPPLETPHYAGSEQTYYAVNVLGFGVEPPGSPELYTATELAEGKAVARRGLIQDYFLPLVFQLAGATVPADDLEELLGRESYQQALVDYAALVAAQLPLFEQAVIVDRDWWQALTGLWDGVLTNSTVGAATWDLMDTILTGLLFSPAALDEIFESFADLFDMFGLDDALDGNIDACVVGAQFGQCKEAETWEISVSAPGMSIPAEVHIDPAMSEIGYYATQTLELVIDSEPVGLPEDGARVYHWQCAGSYGTLVNPANESGPSNDFRTSSAQVRYVANKAIEGVEQISCDLYVQVGTSDILAGEASASVEVYHIDYEIVLPDSLSLCPNDGYSLTPSFEPALDPEITLNYSWNCTGTAGVLEGPDGHQNSWNSRLPDAYYSAGSGGNDTVELIVGVNLGETSVAIDTATVQIEVAEQPIFYGSTVSAVTWDHDNHRYSYRIHIYFDKIPGVARYHVDGTGFYDPLYYGDHYYTTGPPWPHPGFSVETDSSVMVFLTGGSGDYDPENVPTEQEVLSGPLSRFEGAAWEITPLCD